MSDDLSIPSPTYRVPRHRGVRDPATRQRIIIAAGLVGAVVAIAGAWTLIGHRHHGVPVVQADSSPVRLKPENPGGLQIAGASNEIFSGGSDTSVDKLAPPPETPDPQALRAPPAPMAPAAPSITAPSVVAPAPTPASTPAPAAAVAQRSAAAAETRVPASAVASTPPDHGPSSTAAHAGHSAMVQLAALSSEQAAKTEWDRMVKRVPELLNGRQPAFSKIERDGRTYWRVRTGGFSDVSQAMQFCEHMRAKGAGCSVADF